MYDFQFDCSIRIRVPNSSEFLSVFLIVRPNYSNFLCSLLFICFRSLQFSWHSLISTNRFPTHSYPDMQQHLSFGQSSLYALKHLIRNRTNMRWVASTLILYYLNMYYKEFRKRNVKERHKQRNVKEKDSCR